MKLQEKDEKEECQLTVIDTSEENNLKQRTLKLFQQFPRISPSKACSLLHLSYSKHGHTIRTYLSQFRCQSNFGNIPCLPHKLPHWRKWLWNRVVFTEEGRELALSHKWRVSRNRNRMLIFRHDLGVVEWFLNGSVLVTVRGSSNLAMAKTLFWRAFSWLSDSELSRLCEGSPVEVSRHWVFDQGKKMPRFRVDQFRRSHGLDIYVDGSHPNAVEVEEIEPFWLHKLDDLAGSFDKTANSFQESMNEHLKIIDVFRMESIKRTERLQEWRISHTPGPESGFWRRFWAVMTTPL